MKDSRTSRGSSPLARPDLLQGILTTSVSAIIVADGDGVLHFANDRAAEVLGVPLRELLGRRYDDPIWRAETPDGAPLPADSYPVAVVRRTGEPVEALRLAIHDSSGTRRLLSINAAQICGAGDVVMSITDITADEEWRVRRDRILAELALSKDRLERVLQVNPAGIYALRFDREHPDAPPSGSLISQGIATIAGRPLDAIGQDPWSLWLTSIHPDDRARVEDEQRRLMAEGFIEHEYRILRPDDTEVWVYDRVVLLRDGEGRPAEVIGAWLDISDHHAMEEELRRSNAELEQFAYAASHDMQEPLRMVSSYLGILRRRYRGSLDADADEFIDYAVAGAQRMHHMIQDLLAYARVNSKGAPFAPVSSAQALETAMQNLRAAIDESAATVSVVGQPLPQVWGDSTQLVRLFQNLIGNALKYREADRPCLITISAEPRRGAWEFSVADNGIGIDPRHFDRIFQIFQRLHTHMPTDGTGIGLAICKRIVERHGGRLTVDSTLGQGSTFYFTLRRSTG